MTTLEDRLAEALHARADQVTPERLAPPATPAEATPLRRRTLLPALAAGVAAAVVVAVVVVAGRDDDADQQPVDRPTVTESSDKPPPSTPPEARPLPRLLPEDDQRWVREGRDVTFPDGSIGRLGRTDLTIEFEGSGAGVSLPDYPGAPGSLSQVQLAFAARPLEVPYGHGYLVRHTSGGIESLDVVVGDASGGLVVVTPNLNRLPFGISDPLYTTWTGGNGAGLYTRVRVGGRDPNRFEVYRWGTVTLRGDVVLLPGSLGIVCFDLDGGTYERC